MPKRNRDLTSIDPTISSMALSLMGRYSDNVLDKTPLDEALAQRLNGRRGAQAAAAQLIKNFQDIPREKRVAVFGNQSEVSLDRNSLTYSASRRPGDLSPNEGRRLTSRTAASVGSAARFAPPQEVFDPLIDPNQQYLVMYKGLYAKSETSWDGFSNSDEIYIVTTAISIDAQGNNVVRTEKHPLASGPYSDVDTGESRIGPVAAVWQGTVPVKLSLTVHCREHDYGDPEHFRDEVEAAANALALAALAHGQDPTTVEFAETLLKSFFNWVLDTEDDTIATTTKVFEKSSLWATSFEAPTDLRVTRSVLNPQSLYNPGAPRTVSHVDDTHIMQNFTLEHKGDGAHYFSAYELAKV